MDRDELLDQDDYLHVPEHSIPGISADFLNSISGWLEMTPDSIVDAVDTLDKPAPHVVPQAYSLQEALKKEFIPPLSADAAGIFTRSEQILQQYARKRTLNATDLKALIEKVLQNPEFNAHEVEPDMHARLMTAVRDGDVKIHDMWKPGDGSQTLHFSNEMSRMSYVNCWWSYALIKLGYGILSHEVWCRQQSFYAEEWRLRRGRAIAVSYTHLTLPTKRIV